jgi:hypothetical protein
MGNNQISWADCIEYWVSIASYDCRCKFGTCTLSYYARWCSTSICLVHCSSELSYCHLCWIYTSVYPLVNTYCNYVCLYIIFDCKGRQCVVYHLYLLWAYTPHASLLCLWTMALTSVITDLCRISSGHKLTVQSSVSLDSSCLPHLLQMNFFPDISSCGPSDDICSNLYQCSWNCAQAQ